MGMGMFATRNISASELIFSERPLLIYPRNVNIGYDAPDHYSIEQFRKVVLMETEKKLERMVSRMSEEERRRTENLRTVIKRRKWTCRRLKAHQWIWY